jgi:hypothetical protein
MGNYNYVQPTGVIVPDTDSLLSDVQGEFLTAFGADLPLDPATPQGVLITGETEARDSVVRNNAEVANQINPNLSGGVWLDAICALTGLERDPATRSSISGVVLTGVPSTIIPAGTRASTDDGAIFYTTGAVVLDASGQATVSMESDEFGPIPAPVNTLTNVVDGVLGWETVTNPIAAVLGTLEQSDQSLRALRRRTLALQGVSLAEAIVSGLYDTPGVKSLQFRENVTNATAVIDGITLVAHSVWACVDGGTDLDVATTLLEEKSNGANWNGAVEVDVLEPASGQTYTVKFDRPELVPILVRVTVRQMDSTTDPQVSVPESVLAYAENDIDGETGLVVGQPVSPFEIAGAVNQLTPGIFVTKVEIAPVPSMGPPIWQTTELDIALNEKATTTISSVTVVVL